MKLWTRARKKTHATLSKAYFSMVSCESAFERGHRRSSDGFRHEFHFTFETSAHWMGLRQFLLQHQPSKSILWTSIECHPFKLATLWNTYRYFFFFMFALYSTGYTFFSPFASNHFLALRLLRSPSLCLTLLRTLPHHVNKYCHLMHKIWQ